MPVNTINGWTSSGLLPSYTVLSRILGSSSGTQTAAATPPPSVPSAPAAPPASNPLFGGTPLPKTPSNNPPGWGGNSDPYGGGMPNGRSLINPNLNPQQAYSQYLQQRAINEGSTPMQSALNTAFYQHSLLNDADPTGLWQNPSAGSIGRPPDAYLQQLKFQSDLAGKMFDRSSPYSYAYGTNPAQAPAPSLTGYSSGWTNQSGSGFGF